MVEGFTTTLEVMKLFEPVLDLISSELLRRLVTLASDGGNELGYVCNSNSGNFRSKLNLIPRMHQNIKYCMLLWRPVLFDYATMYPIPISGLCSYLLINLTN